MSKARAYSLKRLYGITPEQYDELFERQKGCCAVCGKHQREFKTRLAVDHDHVTGEIRGLLCNFDNSRFIGRHREADRFRSAARYLDGPYTGWFVPKRKPKKRKKRN